MLFILTRGHGNKGRDKKIHKPEASALFHQDFIAMPKIMGKYYISFFISDFGQKRNSTNTIGLLSHDQK